MWNDTTNPLTKKGTIMFKDELEKLILNVALNGAYEDAGQRVLSRDVITATITSIINLVDKEVIGEDEELPEWGKLRIDIRNELRAEQRAIIRSNDE